MNAAIATVLIVVLVLNVRPSSLRRRIVKRRYAHLMRAGKRLDGYTATTGCADFVYISGLQFGHRVLVANAGRPVPPSVILVAALRIPTQIAEAVVASLAVVMAALHPLGTRANKGFEDKAVNPQCFVDTGTVGKCHSSVSKVGIRHEEFAASGSPAVVMAPDFECERLYPTHIRDLVAPFIPHNRLPNFAGHVLNGRSHDRLLGAVVVRGRRALARSRPRSFYAMRDGEQEQCATGICGSHSHS